MQLDIISDIEYTDSGRKTFIFDFYSRVYKRIGRSYATL